MPLRHSTAWLGREYRAAPDRPWGDVAGRAATSWRHVRDKPANLTMLFNSTEFLFQYLPIVLAGFFALGAFGRRDLAAGWLLAASLYFYAFDDPLRLLAIVLSSITFNFLVGRVLARSRRPLLLALGIAGNLALLGYFKYAGFLLGTFASLTDSTWPVPSIELPIGISFYTFTQIAFLVDVHRGEASEYKPLHYALFVTFFPHLIAGPILHHKEMMPQFSRLRTYVFSSGNMSIGLAWFTLGLFKKVVLADNVGHYADVVFDPMETGQMPDMEMAWMGILAYTLQLYFDFSGYSDMAIGLARMIGISFPLNFDSPYKATSIIDFWRRWHITLSRFLRDYLYIPLGGNRRGSARRYLNLFITMLLGGLWHGASWNFVVWGGLHGLGLGINNAWRNLAARAGIRMPVPVARIITFGFVVLAWVPFRVPTLEAAAGMWRTMFGMDTVSQLAASSSGHAWYWIAGLLLVAFFAPNTQEIMATSGEDAARRWVWKPKVRWAILMGAAFGVAVAEMLIRPTTFLYFRF